MSSTTQQPEFTTAI